jgi:Macoilin family
MKNMVVLFVLKMLRQYKESHPENDVLLAALVALREKNSHLENSLSSETRLKMDLFSALGDTKRQIELQHCKLDIER